MRQLIAPTEITVTHRLQRYTTLVVPIKTFDARTASGGKASVLHASCEEIRSQAVSA
jgi:hypothetical protein